MNIKDDASLAMIPVAYKEDKLYSVIPNNDDGDFDFSRSSKGTRVNKGGFIEEMDNDIPRLDYPLLDGVVQDCPTILLEPSRTNRITDTEGWSNFADREATITDVTNITAPDGGISGIKKLTATSTNQPRIEWNQISIPSTTTTYVWSVFVKKDTARYVGLSHFSDTTQNVIFDLDTGSIEDETGTDVLAKIEYYGNGWYRISKGATVLSTVTDNIFKFNLCTQDAINTGVNGESALIWGFHIEIGLYVSSFIPTTTVGAITTRSADACEDSEPDFNDTEGVLYVNAKIDELNTDTNTISLGDGTFSSNSVEIAFEQGSFSQKIKGFCTIDGSSISLVLTTIEDFSIKHGLFHKVAYQYKQADFKMFVNGFKIGTSNYNDIFASGDLQRLSFYGNGTSFTEFYSETKELMTFNQSMTDAEMEKLTSYESFKEMATEQLYTIE